MSSLCGNVTGLLVANGYQVTSRTTNMICEDLDGEKPVCPDAKVEISVGGRKQRSDRRAVMINAHTTVDGEDLGVGECLAYPMEYVQSTSDARDQIYINWLGIHREYQGKGWGRYLLWRTLHEAQKAGYRECVLGTDEMNGRAQLMYANHGFRVTCSSYSYGKELEARS